MKLWNRRELLSMALLPAAYAQFRPKKKYRTAIIGHTGKGNYGHNWDLAWNQIPNVEVVAVADPVEQGRLRAQRRSGAQRAYADYWQMFKTEKPDLVAICPRQTGERVPMVEAAAEVGAHILLEKPFAGSLPDADRIVELTSRRGLKVRVGHVLRVSDSVARVRQWLQSGEIGELMEIRMRGKEDRRAGGEDLIVLGSHCFDMMRFLVGDPSWVFAHVTVQGRDATEQDVRRGTEEVGLVLGDEIASTFWLQKQVHAYFASRKSSYHKGDRFGIWFYGSQGYIHYDLFSRMGEAYLIRSSAWRPMESGQIEAAGASMPETQGNFNVPNYRMAVDLIQAIEEDRDPICSALDGLWTIEIIAGIYSSHKKRQPISFPLKQRHDPLEAW